MHVALLWLSLLTLEPLAVLAASYGSNTTLITNVTDPLSTLLSIPKCGQTCVMRGVNLKTDCEVTNTTCFCASKALEEWLVDCLTADCSVKDALISPIREMFSLIPLSILSFCINHFGLGRDVWTVSFAHITDVLHITYWVEILYTLCLYFIKTSILLFYLRIFPDERFRRWLYLSLVLCFLHGAGFGLAVVFQCRPISYSWTGWTREGEGKCINVNVMFMVSAYVHIFLDLLVLVLPLPQLAKLTLSRWRRARVMFMFLVGSFATVASCIRIKHMKVLGRSHNPTWDYVPVGYWSTIEVDTATACACLPAVRGLIYKIFVPQNMNDIPEEMDRSRYTMTGLPRSDGLVGKRAAGSDRRDTCQETGVVIRRKSDERSEVAILSMEESDEERSDKSSNWGAAEESSRKGAGSSVTIIYP
ncbi:hypothetical protein IWZ03DRAFT_407323 [Phyllosticta citriasiana]|uniref:Extracellular membrane protein CFEM domain-containing protein n=1 Tax=Phyllosticta citriasiana TaxID=595635 RepID=A0ABR1KMS4_9PEZI